MLARFPELAELSGEPQRPGIVHRLDRGTTGVLMVGRTDLAVAVLQAQLAARSVERAYLAVVWGHLESDQGQVDAPLGRDPRQPTRQAVVEGGKDARTNYSVIQRADEPATVSVVACRLETGRTHQIRVHLSAIGHPVVGDATYGGARDRLTFPRAALHAETLGFTHPSTGEWVSFEAPPPPDMQGLLNRLSSAG